MTFLIKKKSTSIYGFRKKSTPSHISVPSWNRTFCSVIFVDISPFSCTFSNSSGGDNDTGKNKLFSSGNLRVLELKNYVEPDPLKELQLLTNKEKLRDDNQGQDSLGCSEHKTVEFQILRGVCKTKNRITALDFRCEDFRSLLGKICGKIPCRAKAQSWLIFKDNLLRAQEQCSDG